VQLDNNSAVNERQNCRWWAHLVGALRVHPHKHCADYPPKKDRRTSRHSGIYAISGQN
jgi:hypothetical protein